MTNYLNSKTFSKLSVLTEPANPFTFDQNLDFFLNGVMDALPMPSDIDGVWFGEVLARNGTIYFIPSQPSVNILTIKNTFPQLMNNWILYPPI